MAVHLVQYGERAERERVEPLSALSLEREREIQSKKIKICDVKKYEFKFFSVVIASC
jgi:hypothetical protein